MEDMSADFRARRAIMAPQEQRAQLQEAVIGALSQQAWLPLRPCSGLVPVSVKGMRQLAALFFGLKFGREERSVAGSYSMAGM